MREFAKSFYKSKAWLNCSRAYMLSVNYVCERCGGVASICHHKKWLSPNNINDPTITLNWDNLEALCIDCHNVEHMQKRTKVTFDEAGNVERVKEAQELKDFKQACKAIDAMLQKNDRTESP